MPYADPAVARERCRRYYHANKSVLLAKAAAFRAAYPEKIRKQNSVAGKKYYAKNQVVRRTYGALYYRANKSRILAHKRSYENRRYATDPNYRLAKRLRIRLRSALRENWKAGSAVKLLGCSAVELRNYIEAQFLPGMTWANHSPAGWHIDHKVPLASFDLADPDQLARACHFTNLQPMWAADNLRKADTLQ